MLRWVVVSQSCNAGYISNIQLLERFQTHLLNICIVANAEAVICKHHINTILHTYIVLRPITPMRFANINDLCEVCAGHICLRMNPVPVLSCMDVAQVQSVM